MKEFLKNNAKTTIISANTTEMSNLIRIANHQLNCDAPSNNEHWIIFNDIHSHCSACIKPKNCMKQLPKYTVNIPEKDIATVFLDISYHYNAIRGRSSDSSSSSSSLSSTPALETLQADSKIIVNNNSNSILDKCPVIKCPNNGCQFIFHYCKLREHLLVCKFEKIKCLNCDYGCPFVLLRQNLECHLKHCPAMVVHCSMEWNRWPLHTTEKSLNTRIHCPSQALDTTNLDVALALRDQRMLKQLWSASRQMKRIMRGRLSVHPAVPIKPYIGIRTHREYYSLPNSNPADNNNAPLSAAIHNGQHAENSNDSSQDNGQNADRNLEIVIIHHDEEKYIQFAQDLVELAYNQSLLEILKLTADNYAKKCFEIQQKKASHSCRPKANSICRANSDYECFAHIQLSSSSSSINLPVISDFFANEFRNDSSTKHSDNYQNKLDSNNYSGSDQQGSVPPLPPPVPKCNALSLELSIWAYPFFNPKPRPMYTFRCGSNFRVDEINSHSRDIHSHIHGGLDGWIEYRCPLFQYGCPFVIRRWEPISGFGTSNRTSSSSSSSSKNHSILNPSMQNSEPHSRQTLIYNETFEAFACPQVDNLNDITNKLCYESSVKSHNRSVSVASNYNDFSLFQERLLNRRRSSNIALNGRIESCSPSAKTTYSSASLFSNSRVSCPESPIWDSLQELNLLDLPFELLQHICSYLDPFTLNSLSFTSHSLRSVVKTFLKHKGYVSLQWKRYEIEKGQYRWSISNKKWIFSTAIAPIKGWRMNSTSAMQKHLLNCPFFERTKHRHPNDDLDLSGVNKQE